MTRTPHVAAILSAALFTTACAGPPPEARPLEDHQRRIIIEAQSIEFELDGLELKPESLTAQAMCSGGPLEPYFETEVLEWRWLTSPVRTATAPIPLELVDLGGGRWRIDVEPFAMENPHIGGDNHPNSNVCSAYITLGLVDTLHHRETGIGAQLFNGATRFEDMDGHYSIRDDGGFSPWLVRNGEDARELYNHDDQWHQGRLEADGDGSYVLHTEDGPLTFTNPHPVMSLAEGHDDVNVEGLRIGDTLRTGELRWDRTTLLRNTRTDEGELRLEGDTLVFDQGHAHDKVILNPEAVDITGPVRLTYRWTHSRHIEGEPSDPESRVIDEFSAWVTEVEPLPADDG